jgi:hypothetical protein
MMEKAIASGIKANATTVPASKSRGTLENQSRRSWVALNQVLVVTDLSFAKLSKR